MKNRIDSLQIFRGVAAIYVALYHTMIITKEKLVAQSPLFESISTHGYLGVNFFFVLSGFIILQAHKKDISKPSSIMNYLKKRFIRVFPVYWVYLTLYIVASFFGLGSPDFSWDILNIVNSYILFPPSNSVSLPLKVAWTLLHEILFYIVFVAFLIRLKLGLIVFASWFLLISNFSIESGSFARVFYEWNYYFFVGLLCYLLSQSLNFKLAVILLFSSLCMLGYYFLNYNLTISELSYEYKHLHFLLAPAFGFIVLSTISFEKKYGFFSSNILLFFGNASYSIYLVHSAVISVFVIIIDKFVPDSEYSNFLYITIFIFSVIGGCLAYLIIEKPLLKIAKKYI